MRLFFFILGYVIVITDVESTGTWLMLSDPELPVSYLPQCLKVGQIRPVRSILELSAIGVVGPYLIAFQ